MSGRQLVVLRHGQTAFNADGRFQGHLDPPLDEVGRAQAEAVAPALAALGPDRLVSSDSRRAVQTAEPLARHCSVELVTDPRLREVDLGAWSGLSRAEVAERFPEEYAAWRAGQDFRRGGGETFVEVGQRVVDAVADALLGVPGDGLLAVVGHGASSLTLLARLLDVPVRRFVGLGNCRWSLLVEGPDGWRLVEHGAGSLATEPPSLPSDADAIHSGAPEGV